MDTDALLSRLAVSLSIGLLIGLERGWRTRNEEDHLRAAGLRTFALTGLTGGITGALARQFDSGLVIGLVFLGSPRHSPPTTGSKRGPSEITALHPSSPA